MTVTLNQTSFTSGELSPSLYGRVDLSRWHSGLRTCRNLIVRPYGGVDNRPGFRFLGEAKSAAAGTRVIDFAFSTEQTYVLELGDECIRVYKDGGVVLDGGVPYEIETPYSLADLAGIKYTQSADVLYLVHPHHPPRTLSRFADDDWVLDFFDAKNGPFEPVNIEENVIVWIDPPDGSATTVHSTGEIFTAEMVGSLFYIEQSNDVATKPWETDKAINATDVRTANGHFYKADTSGTTGTLRPSHREGVESDGTVPWRYMHSGFGICEIVEFISPTEVEVTIVTTMPESLEGDFGSVQTPTDATTRTTNISLFKDRVWWSADFEIVAHGYATDDFVVLNGMVTNRERATEWLNGRHRITVLDADNIRLAGDIYLGLETLENPVTFTTVGTVRAEGDAFASYKWARGAWGENFGWPAVVNFFQQRLVFANTRRQPQSFWMSRVDGYTDFGRERPLQDDDSISGTVAARQVNAIRNITSLQDMVLHTTAGEWGVLGQDNVLTPATMALRAQSHYGSATVDPIVSGNVALFVQEKGTIIRDLGYSFDVDGYASSNVSQLAEHLFRGRTVVDWAYAAIPYDAVFIVMSDGALLSLTYVKEQEVIGWARHDTRHGRFESITSISEGGRDAVYAVVAREVDGATVRYIERLEERLASNDVRDAFFVDSGLSYDGRNATATTMTLTGTWENEDRLYTLTASASAFVAGDVDDAVFLPYLEDGSQKVLKCTITAYASATEVTVQANRNPPAVLQAVAVEDWEFARLQFPGLSHLEGATVSVLADGNVHPQRTVEDGTVTLQYPAAVVHIGLPITADMETLELNSVEDSVRDKPVIIPKVNVLAESSRGLFVGPDVDNLREVKQSNRESYDLALPVKSGLFEVATPSRWARGGRIFIRQSDPLPLSVLSVMPRVTIGGAL